MSAASAGDWQALVTPDPSQARYETWVGADVTANSWSLYSGLTMALLGPLEDDGWRLRLVGGYGAYRYDGTLRTAGVLHSQAFRGTAAFSDALVGYQVGLGALTLKAFAGITVDSHLLTPLDPDNSVAGTNIGFKALLEAWLDIGDRHWAALDLSWADPHDAYASRLRVGHRLWPALSIGLEAGVMGNREYEAGRGGGFVRYEWEDGEISAAAGIAGDRSLETGGYGSLSVLYRF